jgi:aminoglycoside 2''-phosphotransferase
VEAVTVTGVIGIASVGAGDPALDLAALSTLGDRLLAQLQITWPTASALLARARFYRSAFALQEAYYGLRDGDQASFESGIEQHC